MPHDTALELEEREIETPEVTPPSLVPQIAEIDTDLAEELAESGEACGVVGELPKATSASAGEGEADTEDDDEEAKEAEGDEDGAETPAKVKKQKDPIQEAYNRALKRIASARKLRTKAFCGLVNAVRQLPNDTPAHKIAILSTELGLSKEDASRMVKLSSLEIENIDEILKKFVNASVAPDAAEAVLLTTPKVREVSLERIAKGEPLQKRDVSTMRKLMRRVTPASVRSKERTFLTSRVIDRARTSVQRYMGDLQDLVTRLISFHALSDERAEFVAAEAAVQEVAPGLLEEFGNFFDKDIAEQVLASERHNEEVIWRANPDEMEGPLPLDTRWSAQEIRLAEAYDALSRIVARDYRRDMWASREWDWFLEGRIVRQIAWLAGYDLTKWERTMTQPVDKLQRLFATPAEPPLLTSLELCAGAGGQSIGVHQAGFNALGLFERDAYAVETLSKNPLLGPIHRVDLQGDFDFSVYRDKVTLLAGGVPCQPFSSVGKGRGAEDERDLFMVAVEKIKLVRPKAVMLENVDAFAEAPFAAYRSMIFAELNAAGYDTQLISISAKDFGLAQARPRKVLVAMRDGLMSRFRVPQAITEWNITLGDMLYDLMAENGWAGAEQWRRNAQVIGPTLVGASKKTQGFSSGLQHKDWRKIGINSKSIGDHAPLPFDPIDMMPKLTLDMGARLTGFPAAYQWTDRQTEKRRQIANAFPPVMAAAVATSIRNALTGENLDLKAQLNPLRFVPGEPPTLVRMPRHIQFSETEWAEKIERMRLPRGVATGKLYEVWWEDLERTLEPV